MGIQVFEGMLVEFNRDKLVWIGAPEAGVDPTDIRCRYAARVHAIFRNGNTESIEFSDNVAMVDFVAVVTKWQDSRILKIEFPE